MKRFKYKSRTYTILVQGEKVFIVKSATRRFYESKPEALETFVPEIQRRAREVLAA